MSGRKRFKRALDSMMEIKQDKLRLIPAICGAYFATGAKALQVANRDDFIWARIRDSDSEVIQAFNDTVTAHWDLPILVYRDPNQPDIWKVYGRDVSRYEDWGGVSYMRPHGTQHAFAGGKTGSDVVWVFKRQFMPLMTRPNATATMSVWVESDYYYWDGQYKWWPGSGTSDLSSYKPTGAQNAKYLTLYLDGQNGLLEVAEGDEFNILWPPQNPESFIPAITPDEGIPLSAIKLITGTGSIGWGELFDIRNVVSPLDQTGSFNALDIYDSGAFLDEVLAISFEEGLDVSVSGSTAYVDADTSMPIYDNSVFIVDATRITFNNNLDVTVSGTFVWVDATAAGGGGILGIMTRDDGVPVGTGTVFDFGENLDVAITGTDVYIDAVEVSPPNKILLYDVGTENVAVYDATSGGFGAAMAAAGSGDLIWLPPMTLPGNITLNTGVSVVGAGRTAVTITGEVQMSDLSSLENLTVLREVDVGTGDTRGILTHSVADVTCKIINCEVICTNDGSGTIKAIAMYGDGDMEIWNSNVEADGIGLVYGGFVAAGYASKLLVYSSRVHGTTAPFKEQA